MNRSGLVALALVATSACVSTPAPTPAAAVTGTGSIALPGGGWVEFDAQGAGPTVVLLQGSELDRHIWDSQFLSLAERFRVVRYDTHLPGGLRVPRPIATPAEIALLVLDSLQIARATLVALSDATRAAFGVASAEPERVEGMVLLGPVLTPAAGPLAGTTPGTVHEERDSAPEAPPAPPIALEDVAAVPMLLLVGNRDAPTVAAAAESILAAVPGAEMITVPGARHLFPVERPDLVTQRVGEFTSTVTMRLPRALRGRRVVDWRALDAAADSALAAGEHAAYRYYLAQLYRAIPGHPQIAWMLAQADAQLGRPEAAVRWLQRVADMGLARDPLTDSAFASLQGRPAFTGVLTRFAANRKPIGGPATAFVLPDAELVPEDICYDAVRDRFLVTSARTGKIVAIDREGRTTDFVAAPPAAGWATLALAVDSARGRVWVTTAALPRARGFQPADVGRTALLAYDLASGALLQRFEMPDDGLPHKFGDMALAEDGTILLSDARSGGLYRLHPGAREIETVVGPGTFMSPQGVAFTPDGRRALVADYVRGIADVRLATGVVRWLPQPRDLATAGIDGVVRVGTELIAFQNGIQPPRVLRLSFDERFERIVRWQVIEAGTPELTEPTHGVVVRDSLYYIANSGWERLADDGSPIPERPLEPGIIRRTALTAP